jgi:L-rhamnose mutarotase
MHQTGRRTLLRPGHEAEYQAVHATVPDVVVNALRQAGVLRWTIWRDGIALFHAIDTVAGYPALLAELDRIGPLDPAWDAVIAELIEQAPGADVVLAAVWSMDCSGQGVPAAPPPLGSSEIVAAAPSGAPEPDLLRA